MSRSSSILKTYAHPLSKRQALATAYTAGTPAAAPDSTALRTRIEALGAEGASAFAQAQTWGATSSKDGKSDGTGLAMTLQALNEGPESAVARAFTTHVLGSADSETYRNLQVQPDYPGTGTAILSDQGPSAMTGPMAEQVTRLLHPGDTAAQNQAEGRLKGLLQSKAGADVLAPRFGSGLFGPSEAGKQASLSARFQALAAFDRNPAITAQSLGESPWTNGPLVQTMAQAGDAQTALTAHKDSGLVQRGTDLDNFVGVAMHLPPKVPQNETPQQATAREAATAQGKYSYFDTGHNEEPVRLVRDAIRNAAGETGGDRNAPKVTCLPVTVSNQDTGPVELPLFRVDGPKGSRFVDNQGQTSRYGLSEGKHTVATGWTDIPGLELEQIPASRQISGGATQGLYAGLSRKVRDAANPKEPRLDKQLPDRDIKSPDPGPLVSQHAEEDLLNRVHNAILQALNDKSLKPEDLRDRTLWLHISRQKGVCPTCTGGLFEDGITEAGVLKKFSDMDLKDLKDLNSRYPNIDLTKIPQTKIYRELRIVVTTERGVSVGGEDNDIRPRLDTLQILGGKVVQ